MRKHLKERFQAQRPIISLSSKELGYAQEDISLSFKIGSLFLVMPYDDKYSKLENAIRNFFEGKYTVHMAKDRTGDILGCICEKIKEVDFGIVVLAGLKYRKEKKNRVRMNIPFEYGMFKILDKPVMLVCEDKLNIDINEEFSDIQNESREKFTLKKQITHIEKRIGQIFKKFIPELAEKTAKRQLKESTEKNGLPRSEEERLLTLCKTQLEIQIRSDFKDKIKTEKER
jgi:hypothetical protein